MKVNKGDAKMTIKYDAVHLYYAIIEELISLKKEIERKE